MNNITSAPTNSGRRRIRGDSQAGSQRQFESDLHDRLEEAAERHKMEIVLAKKEASEKAPRTQLLMSVRLQSCRAIKAHTTR